MGCDVLYCGPGSLFLHQSHAVSAPRALVQVFIPCRTAFSVLNSFLHLHIENQLISFHKNSSRKTCSNVMDQLGKNRYLISEPSIHSYEKYEKKNFKDTKMRFSLILFQDLKAVPSNTYDQVGPYKWIFLQ